MIFLSSGCIIGVFLVFKNTPNLGKVFVIFIIGLVLLSYSGFTYQIMGHQQGYALVTENNFYMDNYISNSEVRSAQWLDEHRIKENDIYTTEMGETRRFDISFQPKEDRFEYNRNWTYRLSNDPTEDDFSGYLYMYRANIEHNKRVIYSRENRRREYIEFLQMEPLVNNTNLIYSNGHSKILQN